MVREVKFSSEELNGIELPLVRDRFDEADDEFLDGFSLEDRRSSRQENVDSRRKTRPAGRAVANRKHLAAADWMDAVPLPRRHEGPAPA